MKNADFSRAQRVCHVIYIFVGSCLGKVYLCQVSSLQDMCDRFQGGEVFIAPLPPTICKQRQKKSILNRVKKDKKYFLFHVKSSFCSQDIKIFILDFLLYRKNGLIKNIKLISKFMTSQPVSKQLQFTHCPISHKVKATTNHTTKFGQFIEYNKKNVFLQKSCRK